MIEEKIKIHDEFSIEIKLGYGTRRTQKLNDYNVNIWIFFPYSLDINSSTYSTQDFYCDLKYNVRLNTPVFLLRDIANGSNTPFTFLINAFETLASSPLRKNIANYEYHIKMFHAILKSAVRNEIDLILKNINTEDRLYLIDEYVKNIEAIIAKYRELRRIIIAPTISKDNFSFYELGDEFMSNLVEQYTQYLIIAFEKTNYEQEKSLINKLIQLTKQEIDYKRKKNYPVVEATSNDFYRELIFRRSVLKKFVESQLFLSIRKKKDGFLTEQLIYSIAAGFAMIFATAVAFIFQDKFGNLTMPFFVALVISYMLKDRMKDLMRFYFAGKMKQKFFDHKTYIRVKDKKLIGWCKESFDFVPEDKVPLEVIKHRNRSQIMEVENKIGGEKIVLYRKFLRLNRFELNKVYEHYNYTGITDIIRLNVSRYVRMMDNPDMLLYSLNDESLNRIYGERVYFLNLILNYQNEEQISYSRYRIVFNRTGIKDVVKI